MRNVLNLLGYGYRKIGNFDQSQRYCLQTLAIDSEHRGANAYLGEPYLETGILAKAEKRLAVLDKHRRFDCSEDTEFKQSIAKYKAGNGIQLRRGRCVRRTQAGSGGGGRRLVLDRL
jgi:hypothetical protein